YKRVNEEDVIKEKSNKLNVTEKIELYPYQKTAVDNWKENNYLGLLEMATGTGKTVTALACLEELSKKFDAIVTIIVVPQIDLVTQWSEEIIDFGGKVVKCNSESKGWQNKLKTKLNNLKR